MVLILPVLPPLHFTLVTELIETVSPPVLLTMAVAVTVHAFASVTVTVYDPALKPVAVALVCPPGAHAYVYGVVPPPAVAVALPLLLPQEAGIVEVLTVNTAGWVIVAEAVFVQLFASVTVTVYVPALKPVAVAFVPPLGVQL